MTIIKNVSLYGEIVDIATEGGKIVEIGKINGEGIDFGGAKIYPGLIDTHIHGCVGYDTMDGHLVEMSEWLLSQGISSWCPTTTTMSWDDIVRATNVELPNTGAEVIGFHLEGPFINKDYKGAQNEEYVIAPTMELIRACKNVKKISLAPEVDGAMELIDECGLVVSLGHTACDYDTAMEAFRHGATCLTHTYNRMPAIHHRDPGPIGAGCEHGGVYAELICDGKHIHKAAVNLLVRAYGEDKVVLISDSMPATGLGDGDYELSGLPVTVRDGYARTTDGALAGSTSTLFDCVKAAISFGIPELVAVKMATENPAKLMGLNKGKIAVGYDADFLIVDDNFNLIRAISRGNI